MADEAAEAKEVDNSALGVLLSSIGVAICIASVFLYDKNLFVIPVFKFNFDRVKFSFVLIILSISVFLLLKPNENTQIRNSNASIIRVLRFILICLVALFGILIVASYLGAMNNQLPEEQRYNLILSPIGQEGVSLLAQDKFSPKMKFVAAANVSDVLSWKITHRNHSSSGLVCIFLGGMIAFFYGALLARMPERAGDNLSTVVKKFIVPVLSVVLIAFGANEHTQSDKIEADERFVRAGLPGIVSLSDSERATKTYIMQSQSMSQESIAEIANAIHIGATEIDHKDRDYDALEVRIGALEKSVRTPGTSTLSIKPEDINLFVNSLNQKNKELEQLVSSNTEKTTLLHEDITTENEKFLDTCNNALAERGKVDAQILSILKENQKEGWFNKGLNHAIGKSSKENLYKRMLLLMDLENKENNVVALVCRGSVNK
jgi:hypothetical protein